MHVLYIVLCAKSVEHVFTHKVLDPVHFILVREHAGAVVSEQVKQVWWLGDVETNVVPVIEILAKARNS